MFFTVLRLLSRFLIALLLLGSFSVGIAHAERTHRVRSGQTLAQIARRYSVRVSNLAGANSMRLNSTLRTGQRLRIPEAGVIYVAPGQTLARIARTNNVPLTQLLRLNRLRVNSSIQVGQRLVLPGYQPPQEEQAEREWGAPRSPGVVDFVRTDVGERARIRLFDRRGRLRSAGINRLTQLLRHRRSGATRRPPERLARLLVRISDHFGGRNMYVVSGHRPAGGHTQTSSRHVSGEAVDIRLRGVPNAALRDYCRTFERVGVGYYPNSSFVHLDVRERSTYWVDESGPGEPPRYTTGNGR